jgi:hypothetical protein
VFVSFVALGTKTSLFSATIMEARKKPFGASFSYKPDLFAKTGLTQTEEKLRNEAFLTGAGDVGHAIRHHAQRFRRRIGK